MATEEDITHTKDTLDEDNSEIKNNSLQNDMPEVEEYAQFGDDILDEDDILDRRDTLSEEDTQDDFKPANRADTTTTTKTGKSTGTNHRRLDSTVKQAVNRLNDKERRYGFIASVVAAILWLLLTVPLLIHPAKPHKGQLGTEGIAIYMVVGLLLAGIIFFASWIKRRALLGFAVLFTGFSFGGDLLFAIPFYALGAWLIWRAMKVQREAQAAMEAAGFARGRTTRTREPLFSRSSKRAERQQAKASATRTIPAASKRYTPPRSAVKTSKRRGK